MLKSVEAVSTISYIASAAEFTRWLMIGLEFTTAVSQSLLHFLSLNNSQKRMGFVEEVW